MAYDAFANLYQNPYGEDPSKSFLHGRGQPGYAIPGYSAPAPKQNTPSTLGGFPDLGAFAAIDPSYATNRADADAALALARAAWSAARTQIPAFVQQAKVRLGHDQGTAIGNVNENAAERGIFSSGVRLGDVKETKTQFSRQRQDVASNAAQQLSSAQAQWDAAQLQHQTSLDQLANSQAAYGASNPFTGSYSGSIPSQVSGWADIAAKAVKQLGLPASWANDPALWQLLAHESGGNPNADNPSSSAYGLFQFLDSTWAGTGYKKSSDPLQQFLAGLTYIKNRYGSPQAAWDFWQSPHANGGHWY